MLLLVLPVLCKFCLLSEKTLMPRPPPVLIRLDGMLIKIKSNIYALHNLDLPPLFKGGQLILITSPRGWRDPEKLKKEGGSIVQGQVFLKGGNWYFYLIFSRFIIFKSTNYFILICKIAWYIALCSTITSWKKKFKVV